MSAIARVTIKAGELRKYRALTGLTTDMALAERMGMHRSNVSRALSGEAELTGRFIATLIAVFEHLEFSDIFQIERDPDAERHFLAEDDGIEHAGSAA